MTITDANGNELKGVRAIIEKQRQRKRKVEATIARCKDIQGTFRDAIRHYARKDLMIKRTVHQWTPWAISGALFTVAVANTLAGQINGDPAATGVATLGGATMLLGAATLAIKRRTRMLGFLIPETDNQRRWMLVCAAAAMTWLSVAVVVGVHLSTTLPWLGVSLMVTTVALSRTHWARHRIPDPDAQTPDVEELPALTPPAPEDDDEDEEDQEPGEVELPERIRFYLDQWEKVVARPQGSIPGSELDYDGQILGGEGEDGQPIEIGSRFLLRLPEDGVTFSAALASKPRLEMALRRPQHMLNMEQVMPTAEDPDPDPTIVIFEIIDHSPIRDTVLMTDTRYRYETDDQGRIVNSWIECGPYANGDGGATWRVYTGGDSMWGGFIVGGTGSGKSVLLDMIAFSLASSGHTTVWYADGQGGASSPFIPTVADWVAGTDQEWEDMLCALENVAEARAKENRMAMHADPTLRGFCPTPERPGIAVIVDECQMVLNPYSADRWENLSRIARKVGICLIMATQAAQHDSFGRSVNLRSQLLAGNVLVLRTTGTSQRGFIPGLEMDPTALPPIPGYGYTVASGGYGRTAPFRGVFCPDYVKLWNALGYTACEPDKLVRGAANKATNYRYRQRHEIAENQVEGLGAELEKIMAAADGEPPADYDNDEEETTQYTPTRATPRDLDPELARITAGLHDGDESRQALDELLAGFAEQAKENDAYLAENAEDMASGQDTWDEVILSLGDTHRKALDLLVEQARTGEDDSVRTSDLVEELGVSRQRVSVILRDLSGKSLVASAGKGAYHITLGLREHLEHLGQVPA